ncbi:Vms1/Ankzf1 family peptidyl-tRNA hydrolase [Nonomuraea sp. NPDC048916]|uniref:baeRF2 domain-containing protein n=1 Tax=Nonomuraea sp. NPDC048916 TaxID=3154232 RepID=UPI0033F08222
MRLDFIRPLYERRGPYVSVYVGTPNGTGRESHWRGVRDRLTMADPATVDALERAAIGPSALFGTHGDVVMAEPLAEPPPRELATWAPLPHVTPMLMQRGENLPHLRVVVDRAGAELTVFGGGSPRTSAVEAAPWPLPKTAQGGWARRRYRNAAGQAWDAAAVAWEIDEQVRRIGTELILMAGDPRSCALLCDRLGTKSADRVTMVEQGSRPDHERDVERALDLWLEGCRAELLDRHRDAAGPVGVARVAHALREGRAQAVLSPGELPQPVWIGGGGTQMSVDAAELRRWGVEEPMRDRADSALARAAAMTDAELWFTDAISDVAAVIR